MIATVQRRATPAKWGSMKTRTISLIQSLINAFVKPSKRTLYSVYLADYHDIMRQSHLGFEGYTQPGIKANLKIYDHEKMRGHIAQFLESKREWSLADDGGDEDSFFFNSGLHEIPHDSILEFTDELARSKSGALKLYSTLSSRIKVDRNRFFFAAGAAWVFNAPDR